MLILTYVSSGLKSIHALHQIQPITLGLCVVQTTEHPITREWELLATSQNGKRNLTV